MKLSSLEPNAHYDNVHGKPAVISYDNDGSFLYRYNIVEETTQDDDGTTHTGWACREIRVYDKPKKASLKKAIIRSIVDESAEFDLVNSYNKHVIGIAVNEKAVEDYKEYLQLTEDLDAMLVKDLSNI